MTQKIQGNLVWRALINQNAGAWFRFGGNSLLEAAMSISGTVIVDAPQAAPDGKGENNALSAPPPILRIKRSSLRQRCQQQLSDRQVV